MENNVKLKWHGSGIKLFGVGIPYGHGDLKCKCLVSVVRNLDGYQHLLIQVDKYVEFKTSYNIKCIYSRQFSFDYETSELNITVRYETEHGYPYEGYTVTQVMDLVKRIYRAEEIPEGRRNMPDISYWRVEVFRDGIDDTDNWYISLKDDVLMRWDSFTDVMYVIKVTVNQR